MTELEINWPSILPYTRRDAQTVNLGSGYESCRFPFPCINVDGNISTQPNFAAECLRVQYGKTNQLYTSKDHLLAMLMSNSRQIISSHLLEDAKDWKYTLRNWIHAAFYYRPVNPVGWTERDFAVPPVYTTSPVRFIILVPDHKKFRDAVAAGQPDNLAHVHEFSYGEIREFVSREIHGQRFTNVDQEQFSAGYRANFSINGPKTEPPMEFFGASYTIISVFDICLKITADDAKVDDIGVL